MVNKRRRLPADLPRGRSANKAASKSQKYHSNKRKIALQPSDRRQEKVILIDKHDDILLVGEGDFSFARSLAEQTVQFKTLTATTVETEEQLFTKYPQAQRNVQILTSNRRPASNIPEDEDALSPESDNEADSNSGNSTVLYSVDAKKLSTNRLLKNHRYSKVIFNFPHVGGKSTDVNRQVRYNQELVYAFLQSCLGILTPAGQVFVTLFEGEPYSLWNVKDLARSAGLMVRSSFAFDASKYPGYRHARTLGNLNGRESHELDRREDTKSNKIAWKGEERSARTYEFTLKEESHQEKSSHKRGRQEDTSSDGED